MNLAFRALKLGHPISIVAESGEVNPETYPAWARVVYEFPARGDMPPVKLTWYEGRKDGVLVLPPQELLNKVLKQGAKLSASGSILLGDKGILFSPNDYGEAFSLLPEKDFANYKGPEKTLPRRDSGGKGRKELDLLMKEEWAEAIRGGPPAFSNFDFASVMTESILLGNVAIRVGKKLEYDGKQGKVTNVPEAAKLIQPEFRQGWTL